jgi:hypothetical protein
MNLTTSKKQTIESKATSALTMFVTAINRLKESIQLSESLIEENKNKINNLINENTEVENLSVKNQKIINNLANLIGE